MINIIEYNPLENIKGFFLEEQNDKKYLTWGNHQHKIPVGPQGIIPKSGLCFYDVLTANIVKNKDVLDLGCGEMGIISLFSAYAGAQLVTSVDIDEKCIEWVNFIKNKYHIDNLEAKVSNMFENINQKYDIIVSNPPIMPMENITKDNTHDSGGTDGRLYLLKIMKEAFNFLKPKGCIYLSAFSFLGTDIRTNKDLSLQELALSMGYSSLNVIRKFKKVLSANSVTYKQIPYIKHIYPNAIIEEFNDKISVEFQILQINK